VINKVDTENPGEIKNSVQLCACSVSLCVISFPHSPVPVFPDCEQIHKELREDTEKPREIIKLRVALCPSVTNTFLRICPAH